MRTKSAAAAGLCSWVANVVAYFRVVQVVAPKRAAAAAASARLDAATGRLTEVRARVAAIRARVAELEGGLAVAAREKAAAAAQAARTGRRADLARRLTDGLASEYDRWTATLAQWRARDATLQNAAAIAAAFCAYAGPLGPPARASLLTDAWLPAATAMGLPLGPGASDPVDLVTDAATRSSWRTAGLASDHQSIENGALVAAGARWPLLIDPQLQGVRWLGAAWEGVVTVTPTTDRLAETIAAAVEDGAPLLVAGVRDELPPVLDALVKLTPGVGGRARVGEADVDVPPSFKMAVATRLPTPRYGPEVGAAFSVIDFAVTRDGLRDQLLAAVVDAERPDLAASAASLATALATYGSQLTSLEDGLLARLAAASGDILDDEPLVASLESTKAAAADIAAQAAAARAAVAATDAARDAYAPAADRGATLYLLTARLPGLDRVYHYSMAAFMRAMGAGMAAAPREGGGVPSTAAPPRAAASRRVDALVDSITRAVHAHVSQGLFERHRLPFAAALAAAVAAEKGGAPPAKLAFLVAPPRAPPGAPPHPGHAWLTDTAWRAVTAASSLDGLQPLAADVAAFPKRWADAVADRDRPEADPLPGDWKRAPPLDRLLVLRCLRPDRLAAAVRGYLGGVLGEAYAAPPPAGLADARRDAGAKTPILIFLSPGVNATTEVEGAVKEAGLPPSALTSVSLGQGQEGAAAAAIARGARRGGWVLLHNVHLTPEWTAGTLTALVDGLSGASVGAGGQEEDGDAATATTALPPTLHPAFQLVLTAEPPPALEPPLPTPLLQACVKLTAEPPDGLRAGALRAYGSLSYNVFDACSRPADLRSVAPPSPSSTPCSSNAKSMAPATCWARLRGWGGAWTTRFRWATCLRPSAPRAPTLTPRRAVCRGPTCATWWATFCMVATWWRRPTGSWWRPTCAACCVSGCWMVATLCLGCRRRHQD